MTGQLEACGTAGTRSIRPGRRRHNRSNSTAGSRCGSFGEATKGGHHEPSVGLRRGGADLCVLRKPFPSRWSRVPRVPHPRTPEQVGRSRRHDERAAVLAARANQQGYDRGLEARVGQRRVRHEPRPGSDADRRRRRDYTTSAWSKVYALDAKTGERFGTTTRRCRRVGPQRVLRRGQPRRRGRGRARCIVGTLDGRLIALDAKTGKPRLEHVTRSTRRSPTRSPARRASSKSKVMIGNGGAEFGVRGYITAYDAETGELAWRFYIVPGDPAKALDGAASDEALEAGCDRPGRRQVLEDRRRRHAVGLDRLRPGARSGLRRHRQRLARGTATCARRQAATICSSRRSLALEPGHRRVRLALPGDARRQVGLHVDAADDARRPRRSAGSRARC